MKKNNKSQNGFTLLEMVVSVLVILIITAVASIVFAPLVAGQRVVAIVAQAEAVVESVNSFNAIVPAAERISTDSSGGSSNVTLSERLHSNDNGILTLNTANVPGALIEQNFTMSVNPEDRDEILAIINTGNDAGFVFLYVIN